MNESDRENNDDGQLPGNIEPADIGLRAAIRNDGPQTEYENDAENTQKNLTANEALSISEKRDQGSLDKGQLANWSSFPSARDKNNIEPVEVSGNKNMDTNFDRQIVKNELNDIDSASIVQSVGHILRRARIEKGMSIEDVSRQLRLSVQQIEAIEREDFEKLPGRTFLRGFVRNYASLVQLDPIPLLQLLPESAPVISTYERTPLKNKQISFSTDREGSGNNRLVIVIGLFVAALGGYFIFENSSWDRESDNNSINSEIKTGADKTSVEIQLPLSTIAKNTTHAQTNKTSETRNQIISEKNSAAESDIKTETITIPTENKPGIQETEKPAVTDNSSGNLYFKFTADSWVKVIDGSGVSLFEQLKKGGSEQIISGKKPLSIVIGNASGVNLTYNDREIDISSYRKRDGTARFTLE